MLFFLYTFVKVINNYFIFALYLKTKNMRTIITITDIATSKSKSEFTSQLKKDAIITIAKLTKGRICGDNVNSFVAERMVKFTFTSIK